MVAEKTAQKQGKPSKNNPNVTFEGDPLNLKASFWNNESTIFTKPRRPFFGLALTEVAGNVSSVLVLTAYSMTGMLELRITAIIATLLSLSFQYYRKVPLWIPIRWNTVLLLLNGTMVTKLIMEEQRASQMSPELENLYTKGKFQERGFSKVEFLRFYELAETVTLPKGHVLVKEDQAKDSLHFVLEGTVRVQKDHKTIARLQPYHFIGEISLLSRMASDHQPSSKKWDSAATADVIVDEEGPATFLKWEFDDLVPFLEGDREVRNALSAFFNYDLTSKLLRDGNIQTLQRPKTTHHSSTAANRRTKAEKKAAN